MGWSFEIANRGRKAFIESLTGAGHFSENYKPLAHRVVGNHVWQAVRRFDGVVFISLALIAKERNGGWGYKGMSEDMGPYYYDCPLVLLAMCTEPLNESAAAWREKVREHHTRKAAVPALVPGLRFTLATGSEYEITGTYSRMSKTVRLVKDGQMVGGTYRVTNARINRVLRAEK